MSPIHDPQAGKLIPLSAEIAVTGRNPGALEVPGHEGVHIGRLIRGHIWLCLLMVLLGAAGGVASVVLSSPIYKVRTMLEVQGINEAWLKNSFELPTSYDSNQINVQTQIKLLQKGPFLQRVYDRLQAETVPPPPVQPDFFARLRSRVYTNTQNPIEMMKDGLQTAFESFDARAVPLTRLIEISCDSTNPQMAAQFINTMASEFSEETMRARSQSSQKTNEWLSGQIEETKIKLQEAEQRRQEFVQHSGNVFAAGDGTLDDSKLKQLQTELAAIQADRIGKQARYEMAAKSAPENLPEILDNEVLRGYQTQVTELRRQKAALETTLMPKNPKVEKIDAQLATVQASLQAEISSMVGRIRNEYESALNREKLLSAAYAAQLQRVSSSAGKTADFNALQREVETLRQTYQNLLAQSSQSGVSSSVPVNPIRLVESASAPILPYKPRPVVNISLGMIAGLLLTVGIAFLREKLDRSVRHPGLGHRLLNVPQLGVIPSAKLLENGGLLARLRGHGAAPRLNGSVAVNDEPVRSVITSPGTPSFMTESFRTTLASLMTESRREQPKMILVTSPGPEEGKTTIAANLAIALAETGRSVLLVDADFRRPRVHQVFGVPNVEGLSGLLAADTPLTDDNLAGSTVASGVAGLTLLVNRSISGNATYKALYSPRLKQVLEGLRQRFDIVLLDTPPMLHLADARIIAPWTDGIILVLRSGSTDRESALEACHRIQDDGLVLLGTVLNDWNPGKSHMKRHYYYNYASQEK